MGVPTDDAYTHPFLAWLLHNLPHYNVTFHLVNSTFEPHNPIYLESLGILASLPAACLILTLLLLLVYLLTRCCDRRPRPQRSISALKAVLAATAVACCACVGLGLYGNDDAHNGAVEALGQAAQVDQLVARVRNHTDDIERQLRVQAEIQIREIQNVFQVHTLNQSLFKQVDEYFKKLVDNRNLTANAARDIRQPLVGLNLTTTIAFGQKIESWRWPATMAVLSGFLVLLVVLLLGVARHNRFFLIVFSVCGLLAVIISYLMASVYLASSVALGDLCMAPDKFIEDQASSELSKEILKYYTNCERARANPFTQRLREAKTTLMNMRNNLNLMMKPAEYLYPKKGLDTKFSSLRNDINAADNLIHSLTALVDCRTLHMHYLRGARALCNVGLLGLALMLVSAVLSGFLLTILVWVDSHTWIYIRKKKDYQQVTESDPTYLPPSSAGSQAIAARTLQRSQGDGCDQRSSGDHHHHHRGPQAAGAPTWLTYVATPSEGCPPTITMAPPYTDPTTASTPLSASSARRSRAQTSTETGLPAKTSQTLKVPSRTTSSISNSVNSINRPEAAKHPMKRRQRRVPPTSRNTARWADDRCPRRRTRRAANSRPWQCRRCPRPVSRRRSIRPISGLCREALGRTASALSSPMCNSGLCKGDWPSAINLSSGLPRSRTKRKALRPCTPIARANVNCTLLLSCKRDFCLVHLFGKCRQSEKKQ